MGRIDDGGVVAAEAKVAVGIVVSEATFRRIAISGEISRIG